MKNMSLYNIAASCGGTYFGDEFLKGREVGGIVIDSRLVEPGFLFIAVKGARVDGHSFISQVFEKGAACVLCERPPENPSPEHPYILVESCLEALQKIAAYYRSALSIPVIGISGSVGKTSTKEMISSVLSQKFNVLKTEGNFNNEIGLPLTIFKIKEKHEAAVLEMGINHFGEMTRLARMARPDICVITNIGTCHLENLIDRDGVLQAKTEMFAEAAPDASIILNGDDDKLATMREKLAGRSPKPYFFGLGAASGRAAADSVPDLELAAVSIVPHGLAGTSCTFVSALPGNGPREFPVEIPAPGTHMVYNALAAAAVGLTLGLSAEEIQRGIASFVPMGGRSNIIHVNGLEIIDDCYNANPTSVSASLAVLSCAQGRKVAILGDMGELGADEKRLHYETGRKAAEAGTDLLLAVGPLSKETSAGFLDAAHDGGGSTDRQVICEHFATKEDLIKKLPQLVKSGDSILVKASHFMGFEDITERLKTELSDDV